MKGHSPKGSRGAPYLSGKVKADNYFSNTVGENSQDLTGRLNVVKFSILLQRDTTWKNLCEQWTNGNGQRYQGGMITRTDESIYDKLRVKEFGYSGQMRTEAYAVECTGETRDSRKSRRMGKLMCQDS
jgi:hypothetical protein